MIAFRTENRLHLFNPGMAVITHFDNLGSVTITVPRSGSIIARSTSSKLISVNFIAFTCLQKGAYRLATGLNTVACCAKLRLAVLTILLLSTVQITLAFLWLQLDG